MGFARANVHTLCFAMLLLLALVLLPLALLLRGPIRRIVHALEDTWNFYASCKQSVPEVAPAWRKRQAPPAAAHWVGNPNGHPTAQATAHYLCKYKSHTVKAWVWPFGTLWISRRREFANQVFHGRNFLHRQGTRWGLEKIGMLRRGVIWNNDTALWDRMRKVLNQAVMSPAGLRAAVPLSVQAFHITLAEVLRLCMAASSSNPSSSSVATSSLTATGETMMVRPVAPANAPDAQTSSSQPSHSSGGGDSSYCDFTLSVQDFFRLTTFRITAALALGLPVDALSHQEALSIVRKVGAYFKAWDFYLLLPRVVHRLRLLLGVARGQAEAHDAAVIAYQQAMQDLIQRAMAHSKGEKTFLAALLEMERKGEIKHADVVQMVMEVILAGTDTSSVTMSWVVVAFQEQPDTEQRCLSEVQKLMKEEPDVSAWTPKHLKEALRFLGACTDESMRFKPVGPVIIRQAIEDALIEFADHVSGRPCSYRVAKGETIVVDLAAMGLMPEIYPEPAAFNPARNFYDNPAFGQPGGVNAAAAATRTSAEGVPVFLPFGNGPKMCAGHGLADVEMKVLLALWVRTFKMTGGVGANGVSLLGTGAKWEIANQPTTELYVDVALRDGSGSAASGSSSSFTSVSTICSNSSALQGPTKPRWVYLCGPGGSGKTTTCAGVCRAAAPRLVAFRHEVARELMQEQGISCLQLRTNSSVFQALQLAIVCRHFELEQTQPAPEAERCTSGCGSSNANASSTSHGVATASASSSSSSSDSDSSSGILLSDRSALDAIAYMAAQFGERSEQVEDLLRLPQMQWLLKHRYCDLRALVLLVPPFSEAGSADDGVRLPSSHEEMEKFCGLMRRTMERLGVPYVEVQAKAKEDRVREVMALAGLA